MSKFEEYLEVTKTVGSMAEKDYIKVFEDFNKFLLKLNLDENFKYRKNFSKKLNNLLGALVDVKVELPSKNRGNK